MDSLIQTALSMHIFFARTLFVLVILHFFIATFWLKRKNFVIHLRLFLPILYVFLAFLILTGANVAVALKSLNLAAWFMIIAACAFVAIGVIEYKKLKFYAKVRDLHGFAKFARVLIIIQFLVVVGCFAVSFL